MKVGTASVTLLSFARHEQILVDVAEHDLDVLQPGEALLQRVALAVDADVGDDDPVIGAEHAVADQRCSPDAGPKNIRADGHAGRGQAKARREVPPGDAVVVFGIAGQGKPPSKRQGIRRPDAPNLSTSGALFWPNVSGKVLRQLGRTRASESHFHAELDLPLRGPAERAGRLDGMAEMVPTAALPIVVFGLANCGWLSTLNASIRNSVAMRPTLVFFDQRRVDVERAGIESMVAQRCHEDLPDGVPHHSKHETMPVLWPGACKT